MTNNETFESSATTLPNDTTVSPTSNMVKDSSLLYSTLILLFVVLTFLADLVTCVAMRRAKNIHFSTKWYTCLSLVFDCIFVFLLFGLYVFGTFFGNNVYVTSFGILACRIVTALSWVTVTILVADKAFCFYFPVQYVTYAEPKKIVLCTMIIYALVVSLQLSFRILILPWLNGRRIDIQALQEDRPILKSLLGICLIVNFASYIAIFKVVKQHVRRISGLNFKSSNQLRSFSSTATIRVILFVFFGIHVPLFAIYVTSMVVDTKLVDKLRYAALVAMLIICCTNPVVYAWRFREIRYICLQYIARMFPCFRYRAEQMRLEIYHIVISSTGPS